MGSITKRGVDAQGDTVWRVDVQKVVDGKPRRLTGTAHGTIADAKLLESRLLLVIDQESVNAEDVTLGDYFDLAFIPGRESAGRMKATTASYRKTFDKWIRPNYGKRYLRTITSRDARAAVSASTAQKNVLKTFRAVMNAAYDDGRIDVPVSFRRINTADRPSVKRPPWTAAEVLGAVDALAGTGFAELVLLTGISGLRKEEILALTPGDFSVLAGRDGQSILMISVNGAYTDEDGLKVTKTPESVRRVPAVLRFQSRLIEILNSTAPVVTAFDERLCVVEKFDGWKGVKTARWKSLGFQTEDEARAEAARLREEAIAHAVRNAQRPQVTRVSDDLWSVRVFDGYDTEWVATRTRSVVDGGLEAVRRAAVRDWHGTRLFDCTASRASVRWKSALAAAGLRFVPISSLRHFSESAQSAAGVPAAVVAKLHGHTDFRTDFTYYIDHGDAERIQAAMSVDRYLSESAPAASSWSERKLLGPEGVTEPR